MSTVEGKKQEKRRALLDAAYELFLERGTAKTSVEDITSRAKVAKGTFYLYFQDKGAVMQALLGRVSYQLLNNACEAVERQTGLETFPDKMVAVIDHIIEALRRDTVVLKFLERNFVWPGLDQIEASRDAEPLMRKLLNVVLTSPEMAGRTEREVYQRITALGSMCMSVCYSSILEGKPDNIDSMKPVLYDIIRKALEAPVKTIASNAGYEGSVVVEKIKGLPKGQGLDSATGNYGDMIEMGVLDPVKVTRTTLQNAASVASLILITEATVSDEPKDTTIEEAISKAAAAGGQGGGMY